MFNANKDRHILQVRVVFNIGGIIDWLDSGSRFEDIDKKSRDGLNAKERAHDIDIIPTGKVSSAYYHRDKNLISETFAGFDSLGNLDLLYKHQCKNKGVEGLSWSIYKNRLYLCVHVNGERKEVFITPDLTKVSELERTGEIKKGISHDEVKIRVPIRVDQEGSSGNFIDIWESDLWGRPGSSVYYENALGRVFFAIPANEVLY